MIVVAVTRLLLRRGRRRRVLVRVWRNAEAGRRGVRGGGRLPSALRRCRLLLTGLMLLLTGLLLLLTGLLLLLLSVILSVILTLTLILRGGPPRRRLLLLRRRLFGVLRRPSGRRRCLPGSIRRAVVVVLRRVLRAGLRRYDAGRHRNDIRRIGRLSRVAGLTCSRRAD